MLFNNANASLNEAEYAYIRGCFEENRLAANHIAAALYPRQIHDTLDDLRMYHMRISAPGPNHVHTKDYGWKLSKLIGYLKDNIINDANHTRNAK